MSELWAASFHGMGSRTEEKGDSELSSDFRLSPLPDCTYSVISHLKLLQPCLLCGEDCVLELRAKNKLSPLRCFCENSASQQQEEELTNEQSMMVMTLKPVSPAGSLFRVLLDAILPFGSLFSRLSPLYFTHQSPKCLISTLGALTKSKRGHGLEEESCGGLLP